MTSEICQECLLCSQGIREESLGTTKDKNAVIAWIMLAYLRDVGATNALPTELLYIFLRESSDMHLITICANSVTSSALKRLHTIP